MLFFFSYVKYIFSNFQDFYLELSEGNQKITPRDYLELALKPVQGLGKDLSSKNEVLSTLLLFFFLSDRIIFQFKVQDDLIIYHLADSRVYSQSLS